MLAKREVRMMIQMIQSPNHLHLELNKAVLQKLSLKLMPRKWDLLRPQSLHQLIKKTLLSHNQMLQQTRKLQVKQMELLRKRNSQQQKTTKSANQLQPYKRTLDLKRRRQLLKRQIQLRRV